MNATTALGLEDLPSESSVAVLRRNQDLAHFARRVYRMAGTGLRFTRLGEDETLATPEDVYLSLTYAGTPFVLRVSGAWAEALAQEAGVSMTDLSGPSLQLLCMTRLIPLLPREVRLQSAHWVTPESQQVLLGLSHVGAWAGVHARTGEFTGHRFAVFAPDGFPLYSFFSSCDVWLQERTPSVLINLALPLPLVAARWSVKAADMVDLAVGDVLFIQ